MKDLKEIGAKVEKTVRSVLDHLVNEYDDLKINTVVLTDRIIIELHTSPKDVQFVLGGRAGNIKALRQLLKSFSGRYKTKIDLDYVTDRLTKQSYRG